MKNPLGVEVLKGHGFPTVPQVVRFLCLARLEAATFQSATPPISTFFRTRATAPRAA
jgi:hypothetical protein